LNTILFVCVENSFRSVLSEAIFNSKAPEGWLGESAGVKPAFKINPAVRDLLAEIGIELQERTPQLVTDLQIKNASRVITFGCLDRCPIGAKQKSQDWKVSPPTAKTWRELQAIRNELSRLIDILIADIQVGRITGVPAAARRV
jgi:protein-tyrosine-phosphatase